MQNKFHNGMSVITAQRSGDGYQILDEGGNVVAWAMCGRWARRIVIGLNLVPELMDVGSQQAIFQSYLPPIDADESAD